MDTTKKTNFKWTSELSKPKNIGHLFPKEVHEILKQKPMKSLLVQMALKPDFKQAVYELSDFRETSAENLKIDVYPE